jgi:hypothetical protein
MKARLLTGSKQEIAQKVASLEGQVREAIVFIEEPWDAPPPAGASAEDLFVEMEPYMVRVGTADSSREAVYSRMPGE